jgi:succinate dehydrogenase flavin-adding protein (antitoxin of CptAB toxin-antitoxin module)
MPRKVNFADHLNYTVLELMERIKNAMNIDVVTELEYKGNGIDAKIIVNKKMLDVWLYDPYECLMIFLHPYKRNKKVWYIENIRSCNRAGFGKCALMFAVFFLLFLRAEGVILQDDARNAAKQALRVKNMLAMMDGAKSRVKMDDLSFYKQFGFRDYDIKTKSFVEDNVRNLSEFETYDFESDIDRLDTDIPEGFTDKQMNMRHLNRGKFYMYNELPVMDDETYRSFLDFLDGIGTFRDYFLDCSSKDKMNIFFENYKRFGLNRVVDWTKKLPEKIIEILVPPKTKKRTRKSIKNNKNLQLLRTMETRNRTYTIYKI